jgi:hypothetical protein
MSTELVKENDNVSTLKRKRHKETGQEDGDQNTNSNESTQTPYKRHCREDIAPQNIPDTNINPLNITKTVDRFVDPILSISSIKSNIVEESSSSVSGRGRSLQDTMKLALENAHPRDAHITFEEGPHLYRVDGEAVSISVTSLIHQFFDEFKPEETIEKMLSSKKFPKNPDHQKYRELPIWAVVDMETNQKVNVEHYTLGAVVRSPEIAKAEILSLWDRIRDEASSLGTKMHADIELYLNGMPIVNDTQEFQYFLKFYQDVKDKGYDVYRTEQILWDKTLDLAGSVDCQVSKPSSSGQKPRHINLLDWKRSREIKFKNYFQKGRGVMSKYDDCNYIHYCLQLNIYKRLLEELYDVIVDGMFILVFHPLNKSYLEIPVPDMSSEVSQIFQDRREMVARGETYSTIDIKNKDNQKKDNEKQTNDDNNTLGSKRKRETTLACQDDSENNKKEQRSKRSRTTDYSANQTVASVYLD